MMHHLQYLHGRGHVLFNIILLGDNVEGSLANGSSAISANPDYVPHPINGQNVQPGLGIAQYFNQSDLLNTLKKNY